MATNELQGVRFEPRADDGRYLSARVPSTLARRVKHAALMRNLSVQDLLIDILSEALPDDLAVMRVGDHKTAKR